MTGVAKRRILAGLIDAGLMLGWALLVAAALLVMSVAGPALGVGPLGLNLIAIAAVVLPATIGLTVLEAGRYEATPGKLRFGLRVRRDPTGERLGRARSLLRNLLKLGLPWAMVHLAVLTATITGGLVAWLGLVLCVAVPAAYLVSLVRGDGRTIYDRLAGTVVIGTEPGRRFAGDGAVRADGPVDSPGERGEQ